MCVWCDLSGSLGVYSSGNSYSTSDEYRRRSESIKPGHGLELRGDTEVYVCVYSVCWTCSLIAMEALRVYRIRKGLKATEGMPKWQRDPPTGFALPGGNGRIRRVRDAPDDMRALSYSWEERCRDMNPYNLEPFCLYSQY